MRKSSLAVAVLSLLIIGLPMSVSALGLDVEARGGVGLGLGTTDNPDITGAPRVSAGGGIDCDVYLFKAGEVDLGISLGVDYSFLSFHSTWSKYLSAITVPAVAQTTDQTSDATYSYVNFPIMLVASVPLNSSIRLVVKAGGFAGYFLGGTVNLTYSPELPIPGFSNGSQTLDSSNTYSWEGGLNFTAGIDIPIGTNISVSPTLLFNMGLTNTTVPFAGTSFNDTFWALTALVGIKYKAI